jgi:hypothetical protein
MRTPRDWKRRLELRRIAKRLRQISKRRLPVPAVEQELRSQLKNYSKNQGETGLDEAAVEYVRDAVEAHVIKLKAEVFRRHTAEDVKLGRLQAEVDGVVAQYTLERDGRTGWVAHLEYRLSKALRGVEQRDTADPAGPEGVEEPGYQRGNVGSLAGIGIPALVILNVVLVLAMVADLITFRRVAERVVNDTAVFPLVLALTVTTTYVAHRAGEAFASTRRSRRRIHQALGGWALLLVWLAMGGGAFALRLLAPTPAGSDAVSSYVNSASGTPPPSDGSPTLNAVLLLLLYLLTGAIALTAGYHRPRVEVGQYGRTNRKLRWIRPRLGFLLRDIAVAEGLSRELAALRDARIKQYDLEVARCEAAGRRAQAEASQFAPDGRRQPHSWRRRQLTDRTE